MPKAHLEVHRKARSVKELSKLVNLVASGSVGAMETIRVTCVLNSSINATLRSTPASDQRLSSRMRPSTTAWWRGGSAHLMARLRRVAEPYLLSQSLLGRTD